MSPSNFMYGSEGSSAYVFYVASNSYFTTARLKSTMTLRPVVSIKSCVKVSKGTGTSSNPYELEIDSTCEGKEN